ncbi:glycosyltransferase [Streptomyces yaanensis]|uniref:Glycosyltransferase n=1 Tax=Streptomyces yaanensis TaxID=1142239 RepID=A0ABV7SBW4_9ACTN|nr:glycosyltransferase [Streptomyces sp. CGMCC 4.7035]WNB96743.1 glycosyltransferase [Streptomyces sp. CGMCC 4.7035]
MEQEKHLSPRVAWFTDCVLPPSETFVLNQLNALTDVKSALFGIRAVPGIEVPGRTFILDRDRSLGSVEKLTWSAFRRAPRFTAAVQDFAPDLLIAHHLPNAWRIARLAQRCRVPLVAVCHGSDLLEMGSEPFKYRGMQQLAQNWDRLIDVVRLFLPVSHFLGARLLAAGVPQSRVVPHYLGVPLPDGSRLGSPSESADVLFVGRLVENKGCHLLLKALGELGRRRRVTATIVGDGPERERLENEAAGLTSGVTVRFLGSRPHHFVRQAMREHRVVCVPSVEVASGASEGLGLVACEAAANARPVVAFHTGGLPETVAHEETGLLVPQRDVGALADALEYVLTDSTRAEAMGRAARRLAETKFNLAQQGRQLRETLSRHRLLGTA